jgi:hypothetical protein
MATTTDGGLPSRAHAPRPSRRALLGLLLALAIAIALWSIAGGDSSMRVDATTPEARRAVAAALDIVPGRLLGVARDEASGKWEITVLQDGREYEVELSHPGLTLLRLDY